MGSNDTLEMMTVMPLQDYWAHCSTEWVNVSDAAHEAGEPQVAEFFQDIAESAAYMAEYFRY